MFNFARGYFNRIFLQRVSLIVREKRALAKSNNSDDQMAVADELDDIVKAIHAANDKEVRDLLADFASDFGFDKQVQDLGCLRDRIVTDYCEVAQLDLKQLLSCHASSVTH